MDSQEVRLSFLGPGGVVAEMLRGAQFPMREGAVVGEASPSSASPAPLVAIRMWTYNSQQFFAEQIDSIKSHTHARWPLWGADDGSNDGTLDLLRCHQIDLDADRLVITTGPRAGSISGFFGLTAEPEVQADGHAWADRETCGSPNH